MAESADGFKITAERVISSEEVGTTPEEVAQEVAYELLSKCDDVLT